MKIKNNQQTDILLSLILEAASNQQTAVNKSLLKSVWIFKIILWYSAVMPSCHFGTKPSANPTLHNDLKSVKVNQLATKHYYEKKCHSKLRPPIKRKSLNVTTLSCSLEIPIVI